MDIELSTACRHGVGYGMTSKAPKNQGLGDTLLYGRFFRYAGGIQDGLGQRADEPMAKMGMGVIYTATSQKGVLRPPPSDVEWEWLITKFYRPHHLQLMEQVDARLKQFGRALIVDCHSFQLTKKRPVAEIEQ